MTIDACVLDSDSSLLQQVSSDWAILVGGSRQLVGGGRQLVGGSRQLAGGGRQLVGGDRQLVGGTVVKWSAGLSSGGSARGSKNIPHSFSYGVLYACYKFFFICK